MICEIGKPPSTGTPSAQGCYNYIMGYAMSDKELPGGGRFKAIEDESLARRDRGVGVVWQPQASDGKRPSAVYAQGVTSLKHAAKDMQSLSDSNKRTKLAVHHEIFSFRESMTDAEMIHCVREVYKQVYGEKIGKRLMMIAAVHRDTGHPHVHVALCSIDPATGLALERTNTFSKYDKALRNVELDHNLLHDHGYWVVDDGADFARESTKAERKAWQRAREGHAEIVRMLEIQRRSYSRVARRVGSFDNYRDSVIEVKLRAAIDQARDREMGHAQAIDLHNIARAHGTQIEIHDGQAYLRDVSMIEFWVKHKAEAAAFKEELKKSAESNEKQKELLEAFDIAQGKILVAEYQRVCREGELVAVSNKMLGVGDYASPAISDHMVKVCGVVTDVEQNIEDYVEHIKRNPDHIASEITWGQSTFDINDVYAALKMRIHDVGDIEELGWHCIKNDPNLVLRSPEVSDGVWTTKEILRIEEEVVKLAHEQAKKHDGKYDPADMERAIVNLESAKRAEGETGFTLSPEQRASLSHCDRQLTLVLGRAGAGKALAVDTPVLTPTGYLRMGDLRVGDLVMGKNGQPTLVLGVFPQGMKQAFLVTFNDGSSVVCCDEHLWSVKRDGLSKKGGKRRSDGSKREQGFKTVPLSEIRRRMSLKAPRNHHIPIPIVEPIQFPYRDLPIDPYLLGALIGDGTLYEGAVRFTSADKFVVDEVRALLPAGMLMIPIPSSKIDYRLRATTVAYSAIPGCEHQVGGNIRRNRNEVTVEVGNLGLLGKKKYEKFVPEAYKFAHESARLAMLQGLFDTDGSDGGHGAVEYSTTSKQLAEDVVFLAESLGCIATTSEKYPTYNYLGERRTGRLAYRIHIRTPADMVPFRLPRKIATFTPRSKYGILRSFQTIEPIGEREMVCIAVAAADNLYVVDRCIVTHNTTSMTAIREFGEATGRKVCGVAISSAAADRLQNEAGFTALNTARALLMKDNEFFPQDGILVIDEGGMIDSRTMLALLKKGKEMNTKIVIIGDSRQVPPVAAGAAFGIVRKATMDAGTYEELNEIRRQKRDDRLPPKLDAQGNQVYVTAPIINEKTGLPLLNAKGEPRMFVHPVYIQEPIIDAKTGQVVMEKGKPRYKKVFENAVFDVNGHAMRAVDKDGNELPEVNGEPVMADRYKINDNRTPEQKRLGVRPPHDPGYWLRNMVMDVGDGIHEGDPEKILKSVQALDNAGVILYASGIIPGAPARGEHDGPPTAAEREDHALSLAVDEYLKMRALADADFAYTGIKRDVKLLSHLKEDVKYLNDDIRARMGLKGTYSFATKGGERDLVGRDNTTGREGDRILFRTNGSMKTGPKIKGRPQENEPIFNGDLGTVLSVSETEVFVQLDRTTKDKNGNTLAGKIVRFDPRRYTNWEHGYAVTIDNAQGSDPWGAVLHHRHGMSAERWGVGVSRAKVHFVTVTSELNAEGIAKTLKIESKETTQDMSRREKALPFLEAKVGDVLEFNVTRNQLGIKKGDWGAVMEVDATYLHVEIGRTGRTELIPRTGQFTEWGNLTNYAKNVRTQAETSPAITAYEADCAAKDAARYARQQQILKMGDQERAAAGLDPVKLRAAARKQTHYTKGNNHAHQHADRATWIQAWEADQIVEEQVDLKVREKYAERLAQYKEQSGGIKPSIVKVADFPKLDPKQIPIAPGDFATGKVQEAAAKQIAARQADQGRGRGRNYDEGIEM